MARLRPDVAALLERAAAAPLSIDLDDPDAARRTHAASARVADLPRDPATVVRDLAIPGPDGGAVGLRLYTPVKGAKSDAAVLFLHGGGWLLGDLDTHDGLCGAICKGLAMRLLAVDYRRAPEHKFPAALDDSRAALAWLAASPAEVGGAVDGIVLAGDSAGGNMAASLALQPLPVPLLALWTMYASFDMDAEGGSMDEYAHGHLLTAEMLRLFREGYFRPGQDRRSPLASPLFADPSCAPPTLVFANECDPLRDQSRAFAAGLARAGRAVRYREAAGHVHGSLCRRAVAPSSRADLAGCLLDLQGLIAEGREALA